MFLQRVTQPVSQGCVLSQVGQDVPSELARTCFSNKGGTVQAQQAEPGSAATSSICGRRPASSGEMHVEKQASCIRSQARAGNFTWNEIPTVKSQESWKKQKDSHLRIHFPLELIPSASDHPGPCHEDLPALIVESSWFKEKKKRKVE